MEHRGFYDATCNALCFQIFVHVKILKRKISVLMCLCTRQLLGKSPVVVSVIVTESVFKLWMGGENGERKSELHENDLIGITEVKTLFPAWNFTLQFCVFILKCKLWYPNQYAGRAIMHGSVSFTAESLEHHHSVPWALFYKYITKRFQSLTVYICQRS